MHGIAGRKLSSFGLCMTHEELRFAKAARFNDIWYEDQDLAFEVAHQAMFIRSEDVTL